MHSGQSTDVDAELGPSERGSQEARLSPSTSLPLTRTPARREVGRSAACPIASFAGRLYGQCSATAKRRLLLNAEGQGQGQTEGR